MEKTTISTALSGSHWILAAVLPVIIQSCTSSHFDTRRLKGASDEKHEAFFASESNGEGYEGKVQRRFFSFSESCQGQPSPSPADVVEQRDGSLFKVLANCSPIVPRAVSLNSLLPHNTESLILDGQLYDAESTARSTLFCRGEDKDILDPLFTVVADVKIYEDLEQISGKIFVGKYDESGSLVYSYEKEGLALIPRRSKGLLMYESSNRDLFDLIVDPKTLEGRIFTMKVEAAFNSPPQGQTSGFMDLFGSISSVKCWEN